MLIFKDANLSSSLQTDAHCLTAQVDEAGISYAVIDGQGICRLLQRHAFPPATSYNDWAEALATTFRDDEWLTKTYRASRWSFLSNKATLIPERLFDAEQLHTCLRYAAPLDELDEIHYRRLPAHEAVCLFAIPNPPANEILRRQPDAQFIHPQEQLLSLLATQDDDNRIALCVTPTLVGMAAFVENKWALSNMYPVRAFTDALYNLLMALKALRLTQDNFTLFYTGQLGEADEELLRRYFPRLRPLYDSDAGVRMGRAHAVGHHLLLTLAQCE